MEGLPGAAHVRRADGQRRAVSWSTSDDDVASGGGGGGMRLAGRCGLRRDRRGLAEERWGVTGWELQDGTEKQEKQGRAGM